MTSHGEQAVRWRSPSRRKDSPQRSSRVSQQPRDVLDSHGSRFRPLRARNIPLLDYSGISKETDKAIAHRLIVEHGVASIPVSAFLYKDPGGPVLRFCFAKKDETLRAAAERLRPI